MNHLKMELNYLASRTCLLMLFFSFITFDSLALEGLHSNESTTVEIKLNSGLGSNYLPPEVVPGDSVIYTNGSCTAPMPDFTALYGLLVTQNIAPGTMLRRGRYFVTITTVIGLFPVGIRTVNVVDNIAPAATGLTNISTNSSASSCSGIVNYSGTVTDNCAFLAPTSISGFSLIGTYGGHRYFISNSSTTWYNANNMAFMLGGYLATISSVGEKNFLIDTDKAWIGLNEINNVGANDFRWINGEPLSYTYWASGRPYSNTNISGVVINNGSNYRWEDWTVTQNWRYIVEFPITANDQLTVVRTAGLASGSAFPVGTTTVTHIGTDESGNSNSFSFDVVVSDFTMPTITCASTITGVTTASSCSGWVNIPNPVCADNCAVTNLTWQLTGATTGSSPTNGINHLGNHLFNIGNTTIHYVATDAAGNTANCTSSVNVIDNVPPVILNPPSDISLTASSTCQATVPDFLTTLNAVDTCNTVYLNQSPSAGNTISGTTNVIITATDGAGNATSITVVINIVDNTPPIIYWCPGEQTLERNSNCQAVLPDYAIQTSVGDNCSGPINKTQSPAVGTVISSNTNVTITVSDAWGNSSTCVVVVVLDDNIAPSLVCPAALSGTTDVGFCRKLMTIPNPMVTDNCSGITITNSISGANPISNHPFPKGINTITWTATDASGNVQTCTQTVTISDNQLPVITCPSAITGNTDNGYCRKIISIANPIATDNCAGLSITNSISGANPISNHPFPKGITTIIWTATDAAGNVQTCTQTVTISDVELPLLTCGANITNVANSGFCRRNMTVNAPVFSDNCPGVVLTNSITGTSSIVNQTFQVGVTNVVWTATDAAGNVRTCTQTVTITDNQLPQVTCPSSITMTTSAGNCGRNITIVAPTATDNCAIANVTHNSAFGVSNTNASGFYPVGVHTITWTVTDVHGNTIQCPQTITVNDNELPQITCVSTITAYTTATTCNASVTIATPTYTDNCASPLLTNNSPYKTSNTNASGIYPLGTTNFNWTVTDANGNVQTCAVSVVVLDNVAPVISQCAPPQVLTLNSSCAAVLPDYRMLVSATDACSAALTHMQTPTINTLITSNTLVTVSVSDASNNISTCQFLVELNDLTAPTITSCPANQTVEVTNSCSYVLADYRSMFIANDNCTSPVILSQSPAAGVVLTSNQIVTITAQDNAGNSTSCSFSVAPQDNIAPIVACSSSNFTLNYNNNCEAIIPDYRNTLTISDNCTGNDALTVVQTPAPGTVIYSNTTVSFIATDAAGNNSQACSKMVIVTDNINPTISCQDDLVFITEPDLLYVEVELQFPAVSDNCKSTPTLWNNITNSNQTNISFDIGETVVTWYAVDLAGNVSSCQLTVTVISGDVPIIDCPSVLTYHTAEDECGVTTDIEIPTASDYDGITTIYNNLGDDYSDVFFPPGTHLIEWTAIDGLGNEGYCTTEIVVIDSITPIIDCPEVINGSTDSGLTSGTIDIEVPQVIEACSFQLTNSLGLETFGDISFELGTNEITWTAEDASGNIGNCTSTIIITDVAPPLLQCPDPVTISSDNNSCTAWLEINAPSILDSEANVTIINTVNASNSLSSDFSSGENIITWTATDINGNSISCDQIITVVDGQAPNISCENTIVAYTEINVCGANVIITTPQVWDNCDSNPIVINTQNDAAVFNTFLQVGDTSFIWIAFDESGNAGQCPFNISVYDTSGFAFECPIDEAHVIYPNQPFVIADYTSQLPIYDECNLPMVYTQSHSAGTTITESATIVIHAVDGHGNTSQCSFQIVLTPYDVPVITACPEDDLVLYINEDCSAHYEDITSWLNSENVLYSGNYTVHQAPTAGTLYAGVNQIQLWVEDEYGYTTEPCIVDVIVTDNQAPVFTPVNENHLIVTCDPDLSIIPAISDCNAAANVALVSGNNPLQLGSNIMVYTATDGTNTSSYTFTIELVEMPEILWYDIPNTICQNESAFNFEVFTVAEYFFEINGEVVSSNNFDPELYGPGEYSIKLKATYSACNAMLHQSITVLPIPTLTLNSNNYQTCDGEIEITANTNASTVLWETTSSAVIITSPNSISTDLLSDEYGGYTVEVTATQNGCSVTKQAQLHFYEQPAKPNAGPDQIVHLTSLVQLNGEYDGPGSTNWSVDFGNGDFDNAQNLYVTVSGFSLGNNQYILTAQNEICSASDTVLVNVNGLFIPTGYSPNGDNVNDYFEIKGIQNLAKAELRIFNRWGQQVFWSEDYANEWNGTNIKNIELPDDTYFYELILDESNHNGYVVLKR